MPFSKSAILGMLVALCASASASADTIIADFKSDYVAGAAGQTRGQAKADGWNYLWNSGGSIGTAANYTPLLYNGTASIYTGNSATYPDSSNPDGYVQIVKTGGHPGRGASDSAGNGGNGIDHYAIAAYTVQTGEAGYVSIVNSSLTSNNSKSNGIELRVYVNDSLVTDSVVTGGGSVTFNSSLGKLNTGDIVYVCVGPNGTDGCDAFNLSYQLSMSAVPEPKAVVLFTSGLLGLLGYTWRKRQLKLRSTRVGACS